MLSRGAPCTCWRKPDPTGQLLTAAQVAMYPVVAVGLHDGRRVVGRPGGSVWLGDRSTGQLALAIDSDDGEDQLIELSRIRDITPLVAPDPAEVVQSVADALSRPGSIPLGDIWFQAIAGAHEMVEVHVMLRRVPCSG